EGPLFQAPSLLLPEDVPPARLQDRVTLLAIFDEQRRLLERSAAAGRYDRHQQKAMSLLAGGRTQGSLCDVANADSKTLDRYGRNKFGWSMLLAGRLIEAGVSLVQVNLGRTSTWDLHQANFPILKDLLLPPTDRALSALLDDLEDKGLLQDTLIVMASEFGRTPRINTAKPAPGRDHWGAVQSVFFAGGGVQGGRVVGSSDRHGARPATEPQTPDDLAATIYQALGIPRSATWPDSSGRPHAFYTGEPLGGLSREGTGAPRLPRGLYSQPATRCRPAARPRTLSIRLRDRCKGCHAGNSSARNLPVYDALHAATSSGVPQAIKRPPLWPPSGPRSITQSAVLITSRLCSITTTECPLSTRRFRLCRSRSMSAKCRPVVGSSRMYKLCLPRLSLPSSPASLTRWASPPERIVEGWPSLR